MAKLIDVEKVVSSNGEMLILDKKDSLPFEVKRILVIKKATGKRGGHAHKKMVQALICLEGSCEIYTTDGKKEETFFLDSPIKCLILDPSDWHTMQKFSKDAILLALGSEFFDPEDYIKEKPLKK